MSTRPFRFIHASDLHLENPLMGLSQIPGHLRELFLESPYAAAANMFDAVLAEDADFLILSGDVLHPQNTGPRGPLFLLDQFTRLAQRGIEVYWVGGVVDSPESWPEALPLPRNVRVFPRGRAESILIQRDGQPLARIIGLGRDRNNLLRPADFSPDATGIYTIVAANAEADPAALHPRAINYWALGGRHDRVISLGGQSLVHYCGSTQGRSPDEPGVHGCTLVQVDEQLQARTTLIPTDAARWLNERIIVEDSTTTDEFDAKLRERVHSIYESAPAVALLIRWTVAGRGSLISQLSRNNLAAVAIERLQSDFGFRSPPIWSVSMEIEQPDTLPPEWYEQETIRGDFLRAIRKLQMNQDEPLGLDAYLSEAHQAGTVSAMIACCRQDVRQQILRQAASLGVDLLSGEEQTP